MVKNLLAIIALFTFSLAVTAQNAPTATTPNSAPVDKNMGKMKGYRGGEKIKEKLGLTDDQTTKFKAIEDTYKGKMKALRTDAQAGTDRATMKQQVKTMVASKEAEIKALLTPDQYTKYQAMIEARKEKRYEKKQERKAEKAGQPAPEKQ